MHLVTPLEMLSMGLVILTPGQGFWLGTALAKYSFRVSFAYRLGCTLGLITLYGILNEIGRLFVHQLNYGYLDTLRGVALLGIGLFSLQKIIKKSSNQSTTESPWLQKIKEQGVAYAFLFGTVWTFMNPITYTLLISLAPPFVHLQYHWLLYAFIMDAPVTIIYSSIYYFVNRLDRISGFWYGKLLWSSVACIPVYYGLKILYGRLMPLLMTWVG